MTPRLTTAKLIAKLLPSMNEGKQTVNSLAQEANLGETIISELVHTMAEHDIAIVERNRIVFDKTSRLKAALLALEGGADREEVSSKLTWLDFEGLTGALLMKNGFEVLQSIRLGKKRLQIDLLGYSGKLGVAIDCKHWQRSGSVSALRQAAEMQVKRCKMVFRDRLAERLGVSVLTPVVVTLYPEPMKTVSLVPLVPIIGFDDFVRELPGRLDEVRVVSS